MLLYKYEDYDRDMQEHTKEKRMKIHIKAGILCLMTGAFVLAAAPAWANKSSVAIEQPVQFNKDGKAVVRCTVSHSGNNFLHHTEWLRVSADGKEIARWDFSWKSKPESEVFTREVTVDAARPVSIEAEASCNIHGGKGPAKMTVMPPGTTK
jgi:desulfoferrodoxin (superoxide reductase-like protein)